MKFGVASWNICGKTSYDKAYISYAFLNLAVFTWMAYDSIYLRNYQNDNSLSNIFRNIMWLKKCIQFVILETMSVFDWAVPNVNIISYARFCFIRLVLFLAYERPGGASRDCSSNHVTHKRRQAEFGIRLEWLAGFEVRLERSIKHVS